MMRVGRKNSIAHGWMAQSYFTARRRKVLYCRIGIEGVSLASSQPLRPSTAAPTSSERRIQAKITPFLWFDGNAKEAINFYTAIFRHSRVSHLMRDGKAGPGGAGAVMPITFELEGQEFIALSGGADVHVFCGDLVFRQVRDAERG